MKTYSKYINPYIELILDNEVEHCQDQRKMIINNVIPVLERDDVYIDEELIEKGLSLQKYFPFRLLAWQVFLFALIVGVKFKTGEIFYRIIRIIIGRGSGKNGFISFLCFFFISPYHGIRGYNIDLVANSEKQAMVSYMDVFHAIKNPLKQEYKRILDDNFKATKEVIYSKKTLSELRFNSSNAQTADSKRTGALIFDEKHVYRDRKLINTLKSGLGKVPDPREITITTDGHEREGILDQEKEQNLKILESYNPENRTLVFWCRIEKEEEWEDESKWIKAIPSYHDFPDLQAEMRQELKEMPSNMDYYPEFLAKRLNFPVGDKDVEVAKWEDIQATNQPLPDLRGWNCVGAVDYANTNDFVACLLIFYRDGFFYCLQHTFVCKSSRDLLGIKAPLKEWEAKGDLTFIDGVEIPPDVVVDWFREKKQLYHIKLVAIDKYRHTLLMRAFAKIGFDAANKKNLVLVRPSMIEEVSPLINSVFVTHKFVWGDCPIMRWYTNNAKKVYKGNNISYGKIEPKLRKTDGFMALVSGMTIVNTIMTVSPRGFARIGTIVG